ncbi:MAG: hypothetical protein JRJ15_15080 [Deltaproteobacteria bacterium]|nr:hypothetical protein [Deltaproteobacteria bacterium]
MKKLLLIGGVVVIIIVILLVLGLSNLGPIIKTAVNTYGPKITKTEVSLSDVGISIFTGEAKLKDFHLGNPKGFKTPYAVRVGSIYVDVDERSLTGDTIIIDKIEISAPEITYEKTAKTDNFQALLKNVKSGSTTAESSKEPSGEDANGKKIIIGNFIIKGGTVNLAASSIFGDKSISAALPDIHLKDLGKEEGGTSPAKAFEKIFAVLYKEITSPDVTKALNESLKRLADENIDAIREDAEKQVEKVRQDAEKQAQQVREDVEKQAEEVTQMEEGLKKDLDAISGDAKKLFGN